MLARHGWQWCARIVPVVLFGTLIGGVARGRMAARPTDQSRIWSIGFASPNGKFGVALPDATSYWRDQLETGHRYGLAYSANVPLLELFRHPASERSFPGKLLWTKRFEPDRFHLLPELDWSLDGPDDNRAEGISAPALTAPSPALPAGARQVACRAARASKPVVILAGAGSWDRFVLLDCDGSVAADALDRLSVLAHAPEVPPPALPLPLDPQTVSGWPWEWVPGVRLLHPRLVWLVDKIAQAFPGHPIRIASGYRREGPKSPHQRGRALDLSVRGVANTSLFAYCRTLRDVACGFYPNHPFVHVDIRPPNGPPVYWVDVSMPGQPSRYVDSWPGVVSKGALGHTEEG